MVSSIQPALTENRIPPRETGSLVNVWPVMKQGSQILNKKVTQLAGG